MVELEQKKFRPGEHTGKPLGGNVSAEPFSQALYELARSRGYKSQLALGRALGYRSNSLVRTWYTGMNTPGPEYFGQILVLLKPNDDELDSIVDPYGKLLQKGAERAIRRDQKKIKPGATPFDEWMESFCRKNTMSLTSLVVTMGFKNISTIRRWNRPVSLDIFSDILQTAPQALNLSSRETDCLSEAVASTIEEQIAAGHNYLTNISSRRIRMWQAQIPCKTYNRGQAARELGITRERVRQLSNKFGLSYLLTEEDLNVLKARNRKPA